MRPLRSANPTCPPHLLTPPEVEGASGSRQTNSLPSRLTSRSSKGRGSGWLPGLPGPSPRAELLPPLSGERERILRGRISPGPLLPASASFKVASLKSCFPLTDKKRGERGEREGRSTDVNYRAMLRGSPTEPVAMATLSGYGPLWEGARRTTETQWRSGGSGPRPSAFREASFVQTRMAPRPSQPRSASEALILSEMEGTFRSSSPHPRRPISITPLQAPPPPRGRRLSAVLQSAWASGVAVFNLEAVMWVHGITWVCHINAST